ncbi:MAG: ATP-dependent protease LonB [Chloroflexi bacterium]|nr:ATP-dependent protease LonB [Chloroflexota bacterium]
MLLAPLLTTTIHRLGASSNANLVAVGLQLLEQAIPATDDGLAFALRLAADPSWAARYLAGKRLGRFGDRDPDAVWRALVALAQDDRPAVREGAAWGFAGLVEVDAGRWLPRLCASLTDPAMPAAVQRAVVEAAIPPIRRRRADLLDGVVALLEAAVAADRGGPAGIVGTTVVGQEMARAFPDQAMALVERWAASESPSAWRQAARSIARDLGDRFPDRTRAVHALLEGRAADDSRLRAALEAVARRSRAPDGDGGDAPPDLDTPRGTAHSRAHYETLGDGGEARPDASADGRKAPGTNGHVRAATVGQLGLDWSAAWQTTDDVPIPERLIDQVIGQERGVEIIRLAARQRRFILMVGEPGTGKSMLGAAMAEMMSAEGLEDVLVYPNPETRITPRIERCPAGEGEQTVRVARDRKHQAETSVNYLFWFASAAVLFVTGFFALTRSQPLWSAAGLVVILGLAVLRRYFKSTANLQVPKLLVSNARREWAPFVDATGFHAGALLGDVRHDPFQSGGYETPPHELVEAGAIHHAHRGVLFIDEVSTLSIESQQSLLTAIQERRFPIAGRNLGSSGTMVRTEPVPCDFVLVLAGNMQDVEKMHPALRSRVRGYGYELCTNDTMPDTPEHELKLVQFVSQEVARDGKIPPFDRGGVAEIVAEARRRAGRSGRLTTRLRELGGLVRAAGDLAAGEENPVVSARHVVAARANTLTLEEQIALR